MKENENEPAWELEIGFYPGCLIGARSYDMDEATIHVFYLPFIDMSLTFYK